MWGSFCLPILPMVRNWILLTWKLFQIRIRHVGTGTHLVLSWKIAVLRIRDVYPGSRILILTHPGSRISDPGSKNSKKRERWNKISCHTFFVATNLTKLTIILFFRMLKEKIWASFQRIIELFTQKFVTKLSKIWVCDPGSEIRDPEKTYSGSRIRVQGSKRHLIPDQDPQRWKIAFPLFRISSLTALILDPYSRSNEI